MKLFTYISPVICIRKTILSVDSESSSKTFYYSIKLTIIEKEKLFKC